MWYYNYMEIIRAKVLGFCFGVRRAVELAEQALKQNDGVVYSLGPLIHNESALAELEQRGLCTVEEQNLNSIPDGSTVIIRAHGVSPKVTKALEEKHCSIIDATCPRVKASQKMVERYTDKNDYVIISGDKNHGEMIGIAGFAGKNFVQIQNEMEARELELKDNEKINVILMSQTTYSVSEFAKIEQVLRSKFKNIAVMNTICPATNERQEALLELCKQVDGVLVIGGKSSANTKRLYQTAAANCKTAAYIQSAADIPPQFFKLKKIGITAGASTPDRIITDIEQSLCKNTGSVKKGLGTLMVFLLTLALFVSCTDKQTKKELKTHASAALMQTYVSQIKTQKEQAIKDYVARLTLEKKIAQLFIENLEGCTQFRSYETVGAMTGTADKTPLIAGGYIFFSYNIAPDREQMKDFIQSIRDYCRDNNSIQPYLSVDQEGGWVNRLKKLNPTLPSNEKVAGNFDISGAYWLYTSQAGSMHDLGFDMNLAPVVEVCTPDNADFLDGRSFGDAAKVISYGRACVNAYENNGIATVIKHFPGNTNTDPHTGLPEITLPKDELMQSIVSFRELTRYKPAAVLMSHARTTAIDPGVPACLSKVWVTDILRNEYGYEGLIFSDDIFMGALADNGYPPEAAATLAVEAGIDCIMISEKRFAKAGAVLYKKALQDKDFADKIDAAVLRIIKYKLKAGLIDEAQIL